MSDSDAQSNQRVVLAAGAHKVLVAIGLLLVLLALAVAVFGRVAGTTVTKKGETTTTKAWPSETEFTALLSAGAVLVLTGFLWSRISAIKLPGGGEIDLNSDEQKKTAAAVAAKLGPDASPQKVAEETQKAVSAVRRAKASVAPPTVATPSLSEDRIEEVVSSVVGS
jgi:hypothetical protein